MNNIEDYLEYKEGKVFWKKDRGSQLVKGKEAGYTHQGYRRIRFGKKQYLAHHIVWYLHHGYFPIMLDHKNNDKGDNRIENLREADYSSNKMNTPVYKNSSSGIKGLMFCSKYQKWLARISVKNKRIHLGYFEDKELAELVLLEARSKYHGVFANNK